MSKTNQKASNETSDIIIGCIIFVAGSAIIVRLLFYITSLEFTIASVIFTFAIIIELLVVAGVIIEIIKQIGNTKFIIYVTVISIIAIVYIIINTAETLYAYTNYTISTCAVFYNNAIETTYLIIHNTIAIIITVTTNVIISVFAVLIICNVNVYYNTAKSFCRDVFTNTKLRIDAIVSTYNIVKFQYWDKPYNTPNKHLYTLVKDMLSIEDKIKFLDSSNRESYIANINSLSEELNCIRINIKKILNTSDTVLLKC